MMEQKITAERSATDSSLDVALTRSLTITPEIRAKIDPEKRTVEMAFSSEEPVERWGENEVLSHEKGDYDFSRLNNAHPLLLGHNERDPDAQIGVIESAKVGADKIGRAMVRFGESEKAKEIFRDVQTGIRQLVSVGYDRTAIVSSKKDKNNMVTTTYRWTPTHIAIVPVPADTTVGVGRDKDTVKLDPKTKVEAILADLTPDQKERMKILLAPDSAAGGSTATTAAVIDEPKLRAAGKDAERNRVKEIRSTCAELIKDRPDREAVIRAVEAEAIDSEMSVGDFQIKAMREVFKAKEQREITMEEITDDPADYSIGRAIKSILQRGGESKLPTGRELEVHQELCNRMKSDGGMPFEPTGFLVPWRTMAQEKRAKMLEFYRQKARRDNIYQADVFGQGGALIPTILMPPVIELLRNRMVTAELGITTMSGLSGNVAIPRQTATGVAYCLAESATLTKSTALLDQVLMTPHRVGAMAEYSRQLLLQSAIDVESFVRDSAMKDLAILWDQLILNGSGGQSQPLGILQTPGIGSIAFGGAASFASCVSMETALNVGNARGGTRAYVTTPAAKGKLKSAAKLLVGATTVTAVAIWENDPAGDNGEGVINGYTALDSNQIPNNLMIFGNWEESLHGLYGGLDVIVNPYSRDTDAVVRITFNSFGDHVLRHAVSFCASSDPANQ